MLREFQRQEGKPVQSTLGTNPGKVWEEAEFWIALTWEIDPDGSMGIRKYYESKRKPGTPVTLDEYYADIFENSVPGLPEAAEHEGVDPLEYMRRNGAFAVPYLHRLRFTRGVFDVANPLLRTLLGPEGEEEGPARSLIFIDNGVARAWPRLVEQINRYAAVHADCLTLAAPPAVVTGGEAAKNDWSVFEQVAAAINEHGICRHSCVIAVGGGAMLDAVGFAAASAHRGVRLLRVPTTTLAQADSGVGVKNGINAFGKKNFLGAFSPPWAVVNDESFLRTLSDRDWRCGAELF